ncbi:hypothetical protein RND81_04G058400 [Saponaria officinalis]|uniref:Ataxin 2 SM domain-containing protein n=1 Tax=Saponaria officinalis TaxID=3572 RepID=A0AAW1LJV1_SAPOF
MGRVREYTEEENRATMSEALLFTTMCIVGLPVEVHIKDGSIFSGIFHTASFDDGYGIALKKVKMVKKGTHYSNVVYGGLIDTLVVRPGDLVQVLAKGVTIPADYASVDATISDGGTFQESDVGVVSAGEQLNRQRHVGMSRSQEQDANHHVSELTKELIDANHSSATLNGGQTKRIGHEKNLETTHPNKLTYGSIDGNGTSPVVKVRTLFHNEEPVSTKSVPSDVSTSAKIELDTNACRSVVVPTAVTPQNPVTSITAKESKLNPSAKQFSPSLSNIRSIQTPAPSISSFAYVPNSITPVQVAAPHSDVGFRPVAPLSSWPVKLVPYVSSAPANADSGLQYSQPIASHVTTRKLPVRHGSGYQPIQAMPSYLHVNHQNGMFGRPGQVVYMHPVTHDVIQAHAPLSQAPHHLVTSHPIHVAKHEGVVANQALQSSGTLPLIANGPQSLMMPSHQIQFSQPLFSSMRPLPILGPNVTYSAKFP